MDNKSLKTRLIYESIMTALAFVSVILVFADSVSINTTAYRIFEISLLAIFVVDYFVRLYLSTEKKEFFKNNFFDFLGILPFNNSFAIFRLVRILKLAKLAQIYKISKISKIVDAINRGDKNVDKFLRTNGFVYLLYSTIMLIILSALLMSYAENISISDSLWWSFVTFTTVGYGDVVPITPLGRFVAISLMVFGIGFLGILTSTITTFVTNRAKERNLRLKNAQYYELISLLSELDEDKQKEVLEYIKENLN